MTHTYTITGMTCGNCEAKVKSGLLKIPGVLAAKVSSEKGSAVIEMEQHITVDQLQTALGGENGRYKISLSEHAEALQKDGNWFQVYKPVILIFGYILGVTILIQLVTGTFDRMQWMRHFMAGFFLVFSFFKFLNLKGFAESYAMYDVIAKNWMGWGYVYAFTELALGISFLTGFIPAVTNMVTLVIMTISLAGVLQSVMNKRKIKCACLGDVFNLPMSSITIMEDVLMIGMSAVMLITIL